MTRFSSFSTFESLPLAPGLFSTWLLKKRPGQKPCTVPLPKPCTVPLAASSLTSGEENSFTHDSLPEDWDSLPEDKDPLPVRRQQRGRGTAVPAWTAPASPCIPWASSGYPLHPPHPLHPRYPLHPRHPLGIPRIPLHPWHLLRPPGIPGSRRPSRPGRLRSRVPPGQEAAIKADLVHPQQQREPELPRARPAPPGAAGASKSPSSELPRVKHRASTGRHRAVGTRRQE